MRVNYKSDFKIAEVLKDSIVGVPFTFIYQIGGVTKEVSFDGENYLDCALVEGKTNILEVIFDNHNFPCGQLQVHRIFDYPDSTYPDGVRHMEYHDKLNVVLVPGNGDKELNLTNYLVPSFLKPTKGIDYWTEADQAQIVSDTKSAVIADTAVVTALQNSANTTAFQNAIKETVETAVKADDTFMESLKTVAATALKDNTDFVAAIGTSVATNLKADTAFIAAIAQLVAASLEKDVDFIAAVKAAVTPASSNTNTPASEAESEA